jgi:tetratricopeptide (TPR) repeat protein
MKSVILTGILAMAAGVACLAGQAPAAKAPAGPQAKSPAELKAVQAMLGAQDPDSMIKTADDLLTKFADTQFKDAALAMEAEGYRSKTPPDLDKAQVYADQALAVNPANIQANMLMGEILVQTTGTFALDKTEKLAKAEKCLTAALDALKTTAKPRQQMTDGDWDQFKKDTSATIHNDLGMVASVRRNWDAAATEFKAAIADSDQPAFEARLAATYRQAGKNAEAIAICDKILADPMGGLPPSAAAQIKSYVTNLKASAVKASAAAATPAPAPAPAPQK